MNTYCVIPARYNSSRFPGKLLADAAGKTVLQRTFEAARLSPGLKGVFIATDDDRIEQHILELGGEVIRTSSSCQNGTERMIEAVQKSDVLQSADCLLIIQGDHPLTSPETVQAVLEQLERDPEAQMATAVIPLTSQADFLSPHVVKCVFDQSQNALYFSRSPIPYSKTGIPTNAFHHIGIYAFRREFLLHHVQGSRTPLQELEDLEQLKILELGYKIKVAIVNDTPLGIDQPEDLVRLNEVVAKLLGLGKWPF